MPMTLTYLVTTYDYAHYLGQNLAGMLAQSQAPQRLIVSDDASPHDTPEQIRAAAAIHPAAEVVIQPRNLGSALHVQTLTNAVTTDAYLAMSADDWLVDPTFVRDAMELLEKHPDLVAVYGLHQPVDEAGRLLAPVVPPASEPWTRLPAVALRNRMALENVVSGVCTVVRTQRSSGIAAYPILNEYCCDWLHYYLLTLSGDFARINRVVCHYRTHAAGLYLRHLRSGKAGQAYDQGYAALLERPELSDQDRKMLQRGRLRNRVRLARLWHLPGMVLRHGSEPRLWQALAESSVERAAAWLGRESKWLEGRVEREAPLP
jgi:glycosyltransferase involved in cell wall biosynthesis